MDVKKLMEELDRLRAIVGGWQSAADVEKIERDMALDKLKALYEEISFGGLAARAEEMPQPAAAAVLPATAADVRCPEPAVPVAAGTGDMRPVETVCPVSERSGTDAVPEASFSFREPAVSAPVAAENEHEVAAEPAAGMPVVPVAEALSSQEPVAASTGPEEFASVPEPEAPFVNETSSAAAPAFEQKLFDDDRMARIRKDKQVILSLYGDAPVAPVVPPPAPSPVAPPPAPVPVAEPASVVRESFGNAPFPSPAPVPGETHRKVLGEVIAPGAEAMNDVLGRQTAHEDVASRLQSRGLGGDLRHSIGINDRFMLVRNLFDGDSEAYGAMIARLDGFADLDEALLFLQENYRWDPDNEGLQLLVDLLERKLG